MASRKAGGTRVTDNPTPANSRNLELRSVHDQLPDCCMSSPWHALLMSALQKRMLVLASTALVVGGSAHAQGRAAGRTFAPDLCDFAVAFPAGGPATTKTLDIGPAFSEATSMQSVGPKYLLR